MASHGFERFLLLERSGNGKANTSVFEMRLIGKKVHIRHGNKGQKLAKKIYKKQSISEAKLLFSDKRKQKISDGYRIIREEDKNNTNHPKSNHNNVNKSLNAALPISGKSIQNPNKPKQPQIRQQINNMSNESAHSDEYEDNSQSNGRLRHGKQARQNKHRKHNKQPIHKMKHAKNGGIKAINKHKKANKKPNHNHNKRKDKRYHNNNNINISSNTESSVTSSVISTSYDEQEIEQENNPQIANGYEHDNDDDNDNDNEQYNEQSDFDSAIHSDEEEDDESDSEQDDEEQEQEQEQQTSSSSSKSSSKSSVQSGRSSDSEYEMDYEKMSDIMYDSLNKEIDTRNLQWKPIKLWIRFNEYNDFNSEYALAPQCKRIAGSCHELLVIYIRSKSMDTPYHDKGVIYRRLLKLARDPEEDNKYHFHSERHVAQYLYKIACVVNDNFESRTDVCIWPVETILFEYNGCMKYGTIQSPFLPSKSTNNIFVKIEPNSGKPCVSDAIVGRYQHLFSSITRGLDLIRDWQGYGVSQAVFLNVCKKFNVTYEAMKQIKIRRNKKIQSQTQVLIVIDPVLTTYNAHYFTNNPTDFGIKAIDEWIEYHNCVKCRCKYFQLLPMDDIQFGIADPGQFFFDISNLNKSVYEKIVKLRSSLNIYQGDDFKCDDEEEENENQADENNQINT